MALDAQTLGRTGERFAGRRLARRGWRRIGRRVRTPTAELDLVFARGTCLRVVEVKTGRSGSRFGPGDRHGHVTRSRQRAAAEALARGLGCQRVELWLAEVCLESGAAARLELRRLEARDHAGPPEEIDAWIFN